MKTAMLGDLMYGVETNKRKRKQDRRRNLDQWLQNSDVEAFEPRRKKQAKQTATDDQYEDYLPRDPKRALRKQSPRKDKWDEKGWRF